MVIIKNKMKLFIKKIINNIMLCLTKNYIMIVLLNFCFTNFLCIKVVCCFFFLLQTKEKMFSLKKYTIKKYIFNIDHHKNCGFLFFVCLFCTCLLLMVVIVALLLLLLLILFLIQFLVKLLKK